MPKRPRLEDDIKSGNLATPEKGKDEKKATPSLESFVARLSPKAREALYQILVDYSYNDFKSPDEDEAEEAEDE